MNDFLKFIENKIKQNIKVENILIFDESDKHKKHKSYNAEKYHLRVEVESIYLKSLNKISAQREIMTLLSEELKTKIHALEIKIK
mgnify:FL=1